MMVICDTRWRCDIRRRLECVGWGGDRSAHMCMNWHAKTSKLKPPSPNPTRGPYQHNHALTYLSDGELAREEGGRARTACVWMEYRPNIGGSARKHMRVMVPGGGSDRCDMRWGCAVRVVYSSHRRGHKAVVGSRGHVNRRFAATLLGGGVG